MALILVEGKTFSGTLSHEIKADVCTDGPSLVAGWRCEDNTLQVFSDRLGFIPIFYWSNEKSIIVSDSINELVKRLPKARFDTAAVATYLQLGYYIGDSTLIDGVRVLSPASHLTWDGEIEISGGVNFSHSPFEGTRTEAIAEYHLLFSRAIAKRLTGKATCITLSGGRDSRHILLELHRQGALPSSAITLRRRNSNDHEIALTLASRIGIQCVVVDNELDPFEAESEKNRLNSYMADENGWYLPLISHLKGPVFDGLAGDVLSNGLYFSSEVAELIEQDALPEAARLFVRKNGAYLSYLAPWARNKFNEELAYEAIAKEFSVHRSTPNPLQSFVFWNRTRREIAMLPIVMARMQSDPLLPYTDQELLHLLLSLPYRNFGRQGFHDELIQLTYPFFSDIPYAKKLRPVVDLKTRFVYATGAARRMLCAPASILHTLGYASASILGSNMKAIENPFSRVYPLIQACEDLRISF